IPLLSASRPLASVDGKISVGHLENNQRHRRRVIETVIAAPRSVGLLFGDELLANRRIPLPPVITPGEEHRLHGVIVAVEIVSLHLGITRTLAGKKPEDVFQAPRDVVAFKHASVVKRRYSRSRPRKTALPAAATARHI